jgi:[protein-PII] uridylyltransferase
MSRLAAPADAARWWAPPAAWDGAALKLALDRADAALIDAFRQGEAIAPLVRARAWVIEQVVLAAWRARVGEVRHLALIAVGGFGRGELHPKSDVDLLVLVDAARPASAMTDVERFFAALWDCGLAVGHAVRTLAECEDAARGDLTVMTNLLEARHLDGSRDLQDRLVEMLAMPDLWPPLAFAQAKRAEMMTRHARYNDTAYNLEPNLKEGPGGLRDLQTVQWIAQRQLNCGTPARLRDANLMSDEEHDALIAARDALWRIRFGLHVLARRGEERLLFEHQRELAKLFGLQDEHAQNLAVEQFMQRYYRAAMTIERLSERLLQRLDEARRGPTAAVPLDAEFCAVGDLLELRDPHLFERRPVAILRAFLVLLDHPRLVGFRSELLRRLDAVLTGLDDGFRRDPEGHAVFLAILRHHGPVAEVLARMSRYGVLGRYLPAFGKVAGRMQYDLFHVYTVDQHTLVVLRNIRRFGDAEAAKTFPLAHELYARLRKPELLLLAGLFHDIAKGRGGDHSELGEIDAREFCAQLGVSGSDADLVAWLVRQHLTMSITAQKHDIGSPEVVHRFAGIVGDGERLDYLYLLTVADICGTSPKLWNSWKDRLLADLHRATRFVLASGLEHPVHAAERVEDSKNAALAELRALGVDDASAQRLWAEFPDDSFLRYTPGQIAWQTAGIIAASSSNASPDAPLVMTRHAKDRGTTELFVYARDRDGLFATITAVLDRLQLSVVDARIVTSRGGHSLDTFQLLDAESQPIRDAATESQLQLRLRDELSHEVLSLKPARRAMARRQRHFDVPTRLEFARTPGGRTQLALVCADAPGLLAHVAQALRECGMRVHDARIATFGERVEDFFELTDQHDRPLDEAAVAALDAAMRAQLDPLHGNRETSTRHVSA